MTVANSYRSMQQAKKTLTEQTITDTVSKLEEYRQEHKLSYGELYEMSDVALRKLVYSRPMPRHVRKMFAEILKRLASSMSA